MPSGDAAVGDVLMTLNEYLFDIEGFSGDVEDFYDVQNNFLNKVLEQKRGTPITLSILYIAIGRSIGLPLYGVAFPGHFLVKYAVDDTTIILDPFAGGLSLDDSELKTILKHVYSENSLPDISLKEFLSTANTREIVVRMLRNLKHIYLHKRRPDKAIWAVDRILQLMPDLLSEVKERGQLYEHLQHYQAAAEDYQNYIDKIVPSADADAVSHRLSKIQSISLSNYWIH
jgi:regulator of sirC expression with transglutaminase-like and TPR domain